MIPPVVQRPPEAVADFTEVPPLVFRSRRVQNTVARIDHFALRSNDLDRGGRSWRRFALGLAVGVFLTAIATGAARSAPQCDSRDRVLQVLAEQYGETRRALGVAGEGAVLELFASDETGTWTVTIMLPDGQMCLVASGGDFMASPPPIPAGAPT